MVEEFWRAHGGSKRLFLSLDRRLRAAPGTFKRTNVFEGTADVHGIVQIPGILGDRVLRQMKSA